MENETDMTVDTLSAAFAAATLETFGYARDLTDLDAETLNWAYRQLDGAGARVDWIAADLASDLDWMERNCPD
jgi:hypothetical protein